MLLSTDSDKIMISQRFNNKYQLNCTASKVLFVQLANSRVLPITHESTNFSVRLRELHAIFSGSIMSGINHNIISRIDWMRHSQIYINLVTSVITIAQKGVGF